MSTFLGRNGRALLALPVLLVLAVAASSQRMVDLWWPDGMHEEVALDASGTAHFDGEVEVRTGMQRQRLSVRVVESAPTDRMTLLGDEEVPIPAGWTGLRVRVHVESDPLTPLTTCQVLLRDADGAQYGAGTQVFDGGGVDLASCQPRDVVNPSGLETGEVRSTRPAAYDRDVVFVLPQGVRPASVRVSPDLFQFADWPLRDGS